jgi:arylformamidase
MHVTVEFAGRTWRADLRQGFDIAIPLDFAGEQPAFFGAPRATATPLHVGSFTGAVASGASCNCATYTLTPHCNGTHTESFGHLTSRLHSVHTLAQEALLPARLLTVEVLPAATLSDEHDVVTMPSDRLVTAQALAKACASAPASQRLQGIRALVIRTVPHKRAFTIGRDEHTMPTPYYTTAALRWIVAQGIEHLVVDVPSLDRADDGGHLACHRIFWGMPPRDTARSILDENVGRPAATITELAHIDTAIRDGLYLLSLQIAPFAADAAPSRPLLYPVEPL